MRSRVTTGALAALLGASAPAVAHNEAVHQRMTDYAYHLVLAAAAAAEGGAISPGLRELLDNLAASGPGMSAFLRDAAGAKARLGALKSGLPEDPTLCESSFLDALFSGGPPTWNLPAGVALEDLPLSQVWLPVGVHYGHGPAACAIDEGWAPSGELASVNPGGLVGRDYAGVTLGHWSAAPDLEFKDWVLVSTTLGALQRPDVQVAEGAGSTFAVDAVCAWVCGFFAVACAVCPALAVGAGAEVIDQIGSLDAGGIEGGEFVGFGHFIDMKPTSPGELFFDEKPGKLAERAGPAGTPDLIETLVMALFDDGGFHVNHDLSLAPAHYQIHLGPDDAFRDFHPNTVPRDKAQWETPTAAHLQLTAIDNLGMFGYIEARAGRGTAAESRRLGWPLHALGDAAVPMHAVGASGFGHRPYEDFVEAVFDELVGSRDSGRSLATIREVLGRALVWRAMILSWRALYGSTEVPVRDLVTAVAASARERASLQPAVYKPDASLIYFIKSAPGIEAYDNPAMKAFQRELVIEGIAAELAFLVSYTEVAP